MSAMKSNFILLLLATLLAYCVIVLGAYVRLSDAGLGCPDWPGCYGNLVVPGADTDIARANEAFPDRPLLAHAAWKEMIHRYAASTLGLLILLLALKSWIAWMRGQPDRRLVPSLLLLLVIFQGALGMWTVTLLLKPVIVAAHLMGGMTILALLYWSMANEVKPLGKAVATAPTPWIIAALLCVFCQIALGGWTSANYAALVCTDFPMCQGRWWPQMDFREAFILWRGLGIDYEGGVLDAAARTAIHVSHRIGALLTFLLVSTVAALLVLRGNMQQKKSALAVLLLLLVQLSLGIANVLLLLPLPVAVAHNGVAALLLLSLVNLLYFSFTTSRQNES